MRERDYKLGLVARCDNGGLGIESMEFYRNLKPEKVLCVHAGYENFPERFPRAIHVTLHPSDENVRAFLEGLDSVLTMETPYNWRLFELARAAGVRTVMKVNYEWLEFHSVPDFYVLPNHWHFDDVPGENKAVIPLPLDPARFHFRERQKALTFLHVVGHNAGYDRNGTEFVAAAIPKVQAPVLVIIRSQVPSLRIPKLKYPRVVTLDYEVDDNSRLYEDADVLLLPRRYGGQSLVMEEAAACGMPIITTNMEPQRTLFERASLRVIPSDMSKLKIKTEIECAAIDPAALAAAIDEMASSGSETIARMSREAHTAVAARSWQPWIDVLRPHQ